MTSEPKCARCSREILDGELVTYRHGDWFHMRCWSILATGERIGESRRVSARSRQKIADSKERIERAHETPKRLLCVVCGTPISAGTSWIRSNDGPTHTACAP